MDGRSTGVTQVADCNLALVVEVSDAMLLLLLAVMHLDQLNKL
jgi:hypothetical protein